MTKNDIMVLPPCINVVLGKCQVTKSPKTNIELGEGKLYLLWRVLLVCQTFMVTIFWKYMNFDFEYFHILFYLKKTLNTEKGLTSLNKLN